MTKSYMPSDPQHVFGRCGIRAPSSGASGRTRAAGQLSWRKPMRPALAVDVAGHCDGGEAGLDGWTRGASTATGAFFSVWALPNLLTTPTSGANCGSGICSTSDSLCC